jgi:hypothetical protein
MGIERSYSADYFRRRAEEFRTMADNAERSYTKQTLRTVAQSYDALARRAEQIRTVRDLKIEAARAPVSRGLT